MRYYPISINLRGHRCVVIGGGRIAEGKVVGLLEAEAAITVVAPDITPALRAWADEGHVTHIRRGYQPGDLAGACLAIGATDERATNEQVWQEATARNILINVVDDAPHCNFIAPSILRRGDLTIAVSTGGKAPALAVRLRERLERTLGEEYAQFLELAGALREPLAARFPDFEERRALWYQLVDSDVLDLLRQGDETTARRRMTEIMGVTSAEVVTAATSGSQQKG